RAIAPRPDTRAVEGLRRLFVSGLATSHSVRSMKVTRPGPSRSSDRSRRGRRRETEQTRTRKKAAMSRRAYLSVATAFVLAAVERQVLGSRSENRQPEESTDGKPRASSPRGVPSAKPSVLIIVQNLPVPFDRRVWLECEALVDAGYAVSVVCPKGKGDPSEQVLNGVTIYKYRPARGGNGTAAFVREYLYSLLATAWLCRKAWRRQRFDVLQACNPPDIFWLIALPLRLRGVKFVFDHHDLCPELYESRFEGRRGF